MTRYREAQEAATVWIGKLEAEPEGDVARLLPEMLRTVAFQTLTELGDTGAKVKAGDIMLIGRAIESAARSSKIATEQLLKLRREFETRAKSVAAEVEQTARKAGLTAEGAAAIRARILGIAA